MHTTVTARHCEIPEDLRARALEVAAKLAKIAHRPQRMEIVFDDDHQRKVVELRASLPRNQTLIGSSESTDFSTSLDRAAEKLRAQLVKDAERANRRQPAT